MGAPLAGCRARRSVDPSPGRPLMVVAIGDLVLDVTIAPAGQLRLDADREASIRIGGGGEVAAVMSEEATGTIAVLLGPAGERTFARQRGAGPGLRPDELREEWFADAELLHVPA